MKHEMVLHPTPGYAVGALPTECVERLRRAPVDDFGNALATTLEGGPCRHCLQYAPPGESLVLLAYSPFALRNAYRESGPIFIHAEPCARYEGRVLPPDFVERPMVLRAYAAAQTILRGDLAPAGAAERAIAGLFADPATAFVHARSLGHGCFYFRIDRA